MSEYRVRATNSARETENKIHDDALAERYGFRAGLVPGVNVYGYMTVPVVECLGRAWMEHGRMAVKFLQPFYDGDMVVIRARADGADLMVEAADELGIVRATAVASLSEVAGNRVLPPESALPALEDRPEVSEITIQAGRALGSLHEVLRPWHEKAVDVLKDPLELYRGEQAVVHPKAFLALANELIVRNYRISPWIHTASEVICRSTITPAETVSVRGAIRECYERKGHKLMVVDVAISSGDGRVVQEIRHTAIWKLRE